MYLVSLKDVRPGATDHGCVCATENFAHTYNLMYGLANKWMRAQQGAGTTPSMYLEYVPLDAAQQQFARVDVYERRESSSSGWWFASSTTPVLVATVNVYVVPINRDTCEHVRDWLNDMPEYEMPPYVDL